MNEKYTLQFPFTSAAGERIDVLQLRRLKVKDMRAARRASAQIKHEYDSQA